MDVYTIVVEEISSVNIAASTNSVQVIPYLLCSMFVTYLVSKIMRTWIISVQYANIIRSPYIPPLGQDHPIHIDI